MVAWLASLVTGGALKWWLIGAVALAVAGYVGYSEIALANRATEIEALKGDVREARRVAASNVIALDRVKAEAAKDMAAVSADAERARKAARGVVVIKQEIARAPDASARVCEPVDRFLGLLGAGAPDGAARGADRHPGAAPVVR